MATNLMKVADLTTNGNVRHDLRLDEGFIASVKEHGVLEPILLNDGVVWDGHRRLAAAIKAELTEVPVVELGLPANDRVTIQMVTALHRNDLTPLELAQGAWELKVDAGLTQPQVAKALGMSKEVVSQFQKIGKATAGVSDKQLEAANQMTMQGLMDLAEVGDDDPDIPLDDVIRIFGEDSKDWNNSIRGAAAKARNEQRVATFLEELTPDLQAWSDAGIEVTYESPNLTDDKDQWGHQKRDQRYATLGGSETKISITKHMKLDCHVIQVLIPTGWGEPGVAHWCKTSKIHTFKGSSKLKFTGAKEREQSKGETRAHNQKLKQEKDHRVLQAEAWFNDGKATKTATSAMAVAEAGAYLGYDAAKQVGRDLLGMSPPKGTTGMDANSWYNKAVDEWIDKFAGNDADKRARLIIQLRMALRFINNQRYGEDWSVPWIDEMKAIEIKENRDDA